MEPNLYRGSLHTETNIREYTIMKKRMVILLCLLVSAGVKDVWANGASTGNFAADTLEISSQDELIVRRVGFNDDNNYEYTEWSDYSGNSSSKSYWPHRWKWHGGHWSGFRISYAGLVKNLGKMTLPDNAKYMRQTAKSIGVDINFVDFTIVSNRHFGLITGLGLEINNFRFSKNIGLVNENGYVMPDYSYDQSNILLDKSKLTTLYLNIPLLAEFQFGRSYKKKGFVSFGVVGGLRVGSHTKVKAKTKEFSGTHKQNSDLNLRNFHYGFEVNAGYRHISVFAKYYPHSIFTANGGPKVQQVNLGLGLTF